MSKINIIFFLILIFVPSKSISLENKILYKVNNEIITSYDIELEIKYLKTLNPRIINLSENEIIKIATNSIINEKIKIIELNKYFKLGEDLDSESLLSVVKKIYTDIGYKNEEEFKKYLNKTNQSYELIISKIQVETYWNNLIYNKFNNQVLVNENKIEQIIKTEIKQNENLKNYLLSEIVLKNEKNFDIEKKFQEIKISISNIGFDNTANIYSQSNSAKFGGKIGWIEETSLSKVIQSELIKITEGEYTPPIKLLENYIILKIEEIKLTEIDFDIKKLLQQRINYEKNIQLDRFSTTYFNRVKQNIKINEL